MEQAIEVLFVVAVLLAVGLAIATPFVIRNKRAEKAAAKKLREEMTAEGRAAAARWRHDNKRR
jgi:hypothetical protein